MSNLDLVPAASGDDVLSGDDRLRRGVAAYQSRFKGRSRVHAEVRPTRVPGGVRGPTVAAARGHPYLFELTIEHVMQPEYACGNEFDAGLANVLAGITDSLPQYRGAARTTGSGSGRGWRGDSTSLHRLVHVGEPRSDPAQWVV